jgi:hypothetical protein
MQNLCDVCGLREIHQIAGIVFVAFVVLFKVSQQCLKSN